MVQIVQNWAAIFTYLPNYLPSNVDTIDIGQISGVPNVPIVTKQMVFMMVMVAKDFQEKRLSMPTKSKRCFIIFTFKIIVLSLYICLWKVLIERIN